MSKKPNRKRIPIEGETVRVSVPMSKRHREELAALAREARVGLSRYVYDAALGRAGIEAAGKAAE